MKWTLGDNHEKTLVDFSDVNAATQSGPSVIKSVKKKKNNKREKEEINKQTPEKKWKCWRLRSPARQIYQHIKYIFCWRVAVIWQTAQISVAWTCYCIFTLTSLNLVDLTSTTGVSVIASVMPSRKWSFAHSVQWVCVPDSWRVTPCPDGYYLPCWMEGQLGLVGERAVVGEWGRGRCQGSQIRAVWVSEAAW